MSVRGFAAPVAAAGRRGDRHAQRVAPALAPAHPVGRLLALQSGAGNRALAGLLAPSRGAADAPRTVQRCGAMAPGECPCHGDDEAAQTAPPAAAPAAQRVVQRRVDGDVRQMSINTGWARALTDAELAQQSGLLRTHIATLAADPTQRAGAEANLRVLDDELRRRTAAQTLANLTLGPDVPRPPGVPADGGHAVVEIPGVHPDVLGVLPEGQLTTVTTAHLFVPPALTGLGTFGPPPPPVARGAEALGAGGGGAVLASGINMARWGFPGGLGQEAYSIGIIVRPRAGLSGAANLDWGHTALVLRRAGVPLETVGFNPDMRTARGLIEIGSNARGVEAGQASVPGRFTGDNAMFGQSNAVHIEYPITEAEAAQFAMQKPGLAPQNLRYTARPAVYAARGGCGGTNCGLWAIGEIERQANGVVGRAGDPAGITSMGRDGVVQAGRGSQPAIIDMANQGLADPATIRPLAPGGQPAVVSAMPRVIRVLRVGGKVLLVVGVAVGVYEIATARTEDRTRTAVGVGAGFAGGFALGATAGLICGPGAPLCSGLLGLGLGVVGALGARYAAEEIYDAATAPAPAPTGASPSGTAPPAATGPGPEDWQYLFTPPPTPQQALFGQIIGGSPMSVRPATSIDLAFAPQ